MSKLKSKLNEYFYAWGDNDPKKQVWYYGKYITLEKLLGYDDYQYYRPRRAAAGWGIILGGLGALTLSVYGVSYLKEKYDERKKDKENL